MSWLGKSTMTAFLAEQLLVYLKSDIRDAFVRTSERGKEWLDEFLERINRHHGAARHVPILSCLSHSSA
jgi:hypothetical protein